MNNLESPNHHLEHQKNQPVLVSRSVIGCVSGFVGSLFLLAITFLLGPNLVGLIILGQHLLFKQFVYSIYSLLYGGWEEGIISYALVEVISIIVFSSIWGLIGVLLISGKKKQRIAGSIFILLYVIAGYISFQSYGSSIIPT